LDVWFWGYANGQTDRQANRQTDRHTHTDTMIAILSTPTG